MGSCGQASGGGGHAVTQLCSTQGFYSTNAPVTLGRGSLPSCLCSSDAGVPHQRFQWSWARKWPGRQASELLGGSCVQPGEGLASPHILSSWGAPFLSTSWAAALFRAVFSLSLSAPPLSAPSLWSSKCPV